MKTRIIKTMLVGGLLVVQAATAFTQDARFFRIVGPVATTITDVTADGTVTWTNEVTNATFTVQTATALPDAANWVVWVQVPSSNAVTVHRIFDPNPLPGMALIPAGSFTMGDTFSEAGTSERPTHTVYVSAFYMDKYEVTKALWDEVYNWAITHGYSFDYANSGQGKAANHPAHTMTWYDAVKWCNARSEKEGRVPAYYTSAAQTGVYRSGQVNVQNDWVKWNTGYRLPTEAEWEKAARGGASGRRFPWSGTIFPWGHEDIITHSQANYDAGYYYWDYDWTFLSYPPGYHPTFATGGTPYTSPVGYFAANGYGLYDMAGNVVELCWDWYLSTYYSSSPSSDPRGPTSGLDRGLRGGSWGDNASLARCAYRLSYRPDGRNDHVGFRCVLAGVSVP